MCSRDKPIFSTNFRRLSNNPFHCDCNLVWFLRARNKLFRTVSPLELIRLKCASPPKFRGKSISDIKEKDVCTAGTVSENAIYLTAFGWKMPGEIDSCKLFHANTSLWLKKPLKSLRFIKKNISCK